EIGTLEGANGGITLSGDATSSIEIGSAGTGVTGAITGDAGVTIAESGSFSASAIVDDGLIRVEPGRSLSLNGSGRGLSGQGTIEIGHGSSLTIYGVDPGASDQVTIDFAGPGGALWLGSNDFDALGNFAPALAHYSATDVIEYQGAATSAS